MKTLYKSNKLSYAVFLALTCSPISIHANPPDREPCTPVSSRFRYLDPCAHQAVPRTPNNSPQQPRRHLGVNTQNAAPIPVVARNLQLPEPADTWIVRAGTRKCGK